MLHENSMNSSEIIVTQGFKLKIRQNTNIVQTKWALDFDVNTDTVNPYPV